MYINHGQDESDDRDADDQDGLHMNHDSVLIADDPIYENPLSSLEASIPVSFQRRKWNRLRKHYHDQYLELFNSTLQADHGNYFGGGLPASQLGAVVWLPDEKAKLYQGLCRKGRHDLASLATWIGSKSVVEIKAYLDNLCEQETDRQRFEAQPKNVSLAEIPAAVEIGPDCEAVVDQVADALLAFQDQYDFAAGQQANDLWLIDQAVAEKLDQRLDESSNPDDANREGSDSDVLRFPERALKLFRLSAFVELSERLFMNRGVDNPGSWQNIAEAGERPSLTIDYVTSLYDLVVNLLRRILQSCIFTTQSRLRASTSQDYRPSRIVKIEDVVGTLDVLGVKRNADPYWSGLARRNGLKVVDSSHRRGIDSTAVLPYNEVEETLSQSGQSRSVSTALEEITEDDFSQDTSGSSDGSQSEVDLGDTSGGEDDEGMSGDDNSAEEVADENDTQAAYGTSEHEQHAKSRVPRHKRLRMLEDEQDEYLERLDQKARQREESHLLSLLGAQEDKKVKVEEMDDLGKRPPQPRKSIEHSVGWAISYEAEWELRVKRRRLDTSEED